MLLATRILLVLVSVAAASTVLTLLVQDSGLASDLRKAAHGRLERASAMASQLIDDHLIAQLERYQAISATPQFLANLEARHIPTLSHFATELAEQHDAVSVMFLDSDGKEVTGTGDEELRTLAREHLLARAGSQARRRVAGRSAATLLSHAGVAHSVVSVVLGGESRAFGSLVAVEAIGAEDLNAWSSLCRARVSVGAPTAGNHMSLPVRPAGDLQLHVMTSFDAEREALANSRYNLISGGLLGLAIALAASIFLARSLVRPIRTIQAATERIGAGELQFRLDMHRGDEFGDVVNALNLMLERLEQNTRERIRVENQISHLAFHDSLTGLANRRLLRERLGSALQESRSKQSGVAVMFLDLDRFKQVNDTLGHTAGDELLIEVANRLTACVASVERAPEDQQSKTLLARLGGDEFTVLLTGVQDRGQVEALADQILDSLGTPFNVRGEEVTVGASLGIALSPEDAEDVESLLSDSDMAMFHAKNQGGRTYEFYADSMQEIAAKRLALEHKLARALENDEFELFYQPKLDLERDEITGLEALLRWRDQTRGIVGPGEFIAMAEETGAIIPIGEWVLRTAIEQVLKWQKEGLPRVRVAVNVSVRQVEHRRDFAQQVADLLEETGLEPGLLDLEITEGALLQDEEATIALLERLRDMGVGLSLDDFGTGYSSLSYLRRLPIDTLKIDRSFIPGPKSGPQDGALVQSIIAMAKNLGLRVVAEGVETRKQRAFLEGLGCDEIQGFLFSVPLDAEAAGALLRRRQHQKRKKKPTPKRGPARTGRGQ